MDDLIVAGKLICKQAQRARREGKLPTFVGADGLLAIMHADIQNHFDRVDEEDDEWILHLAVHALAAVSLHVNTGVSDDDVDEVREVPQVVHGSSGVPETRQEVSEELDEEEEDEYEPVEDDSRWTPIDPDEED